MPVEASLEKYDCSVNKLQIGHIPFMICIFSTTFYENTLFLIFSLQTFKFVFFSYLSFYFQKMERQQYIDYFINNKKKPNSLTIYNTHQSSKLSKSLHHGNKSVKKILPHITEEYQFKITNQLLVHKIMNPKRDKLITQNFQKTPPRPQTKARKSRGNTIYRRQNQIKSLDVNRMKGQNPNDGSMSLMARIRQRQNQSSKKIKGMKSYQQEFNLALENERMGRRIINAKSSVEEILKKTFHTYKNQSRSKQHQKQNFQPDLKSSFIRGRQNNKIYFTGKINNGVKVFFNPLRNDDKSLSRSQTQSMNRSKVSNSPGDANDDNGSQSSLGSKNNRSYPARMAKTSTNNRSYILRKKQNETEQSHHIETNFPESFKIFGRGPTILMIYDLEIVSNPPLKDESMLILELITHEKLIGHKKKKEKTIRTMPISYEFMKPCPSSQTSNCIRFAINVSEIGDFVPLRIYKVHGVQIQQLGIIDMDLAAFRYRREAIDQGSNGKLVKQYRVDKYGQRLERDIVSGSAQSSLRKNLLNKPVETYVSMNYKIYPKKFKPVDERIA